MKPNFRLATLSIHTAICLLAGATFASTGTVEELTFPTGTQSISGSINGIAITENWLLVGVGSASYKATANGPLMTAAGEVQVYSTVSGKLVRRLRPSKPQAGGHFGNMVAASGSRAYALQGSSILEAFDIASGKSLWRNTGEKIESDGMNNASVSSLSADGNTVIAGMPTAWLIEYPPLDYYQNQGFIRRLKAQTGDEFSPLSCFTGQGFSDFGASVAVSGGRVVVGSPRRDVSGVTDCGMATLIHNGSPNEPKWDLYAPDANDGDLFGTSVAISKDWIVVGAPAKDVGGRDNAGGVYIFSATTLALVTKLDAPPSVPAGTRFGHSVAASGNLALIGAIGKAGTPAVWLYDLAEGKLEVLMQNEPGQVKFYASALAVSGAKAAVLDGYTSGGSALTGHAHLAKGLGRSWGDVSVIAATKQAAPGVAGAKFSVLGDAAQSSDGKVMHTGSMIGTGVAATNNQGLWNNVSGAQEMILQEGALFAGAKLGAPSRAIFTPGSFGLFFARPAGSTKNGLFLDNGNAVTRSLTEGGVVNVNGVTETLEKLHEVVSCPGQNGIATVRYASRIGVSGVTSSTDSRVGQRGIQIIDEIREGDPSPKAGLKIGQIAPRVATGGSTIACVAALQGAPAATNSALLAKVIGVMDSARVVAQKGLPAEGAGSAKYSAFLSEVVAGNGIAYRASLTGGAPGVTSGIWHHVPNAAGWLNKPVALSLGQAPGLPVGVKFSRFVNLFLTNANEVVFSAQVIGPGVTSANDMGIWYWASDKVTLLLREGDDLPGSDGAVVGSLQRMEVGLDSRYAILVSLGRSSTGANQALLAGSLTYPVLASRLPGLSLRKGEMIDRTAPTPIRGLGMGRNNLDITGSGTKGIAKLVGTKGVVFSAVFADATELLLGRP